MYTRSMGISKDRGIAVFLGARKLAIVNSLAGQLAVQVLRHLRAVQQAAGQEQLAVRACGNATTSARKNDAKATATHATRVQLNSA